MKASSTRPARSHASASAARSASSMRTTTPGWAAAEGPDEPADRVGGEGRQGDHLERAGDERRHRGRHGHDLGRLAQHAAGGVDHPFAGGGGPHRAAESLEQLDAELGLELAHAVRQRRLRQVQGRARRW